MDSKSRGVDVPTGGAMTADPAVDPDSEVVLHAERLTTSRERVAVERVRFAKRIVTTTRTIEVPVRVEELVVTRGPLSGDLDGAPFDAAPGRGGEELVIVLHEEVPEVVVRGGIPVEKITVTVRSVAGEQVVSADLRREVVDVELSAQDDRVELQSGPSV